MSLFVAPVWKESFGRVSPFAMSMGVPVVGYKLALWRKFLATPAFFRHGNSDELAKIIIGLLDDKERRQQVGYRNRERAHKLFSVENMIDNYLKLYQELIGNKR